MSGPFGSDTFLYKHTFYPYEIEQSLRFNDDDSAYLSRTPASAGNRKTWTWSGWVKRGGVGTFQNIFGVNTYSTNNWLYIHFRDDNRFQVNAVQSGVDNVQLYTTQVFRDVSAWYHLVVTFDTTQATSSDRVKIYVNGTRITQFDVSTYPAQNHDAAVNTTNVHSIGRWDTSRYFDGYMAEVNFVDGQALDPTSFGENKSGVWIPKRYSGSYGTNGFYLDFGNSGSLGADSSGNSNNWTPTNLAATDQVLDSPTNNWCTFEPNAGTQFNTNDINYSEGNLKATNAAAASANGSSTFLIPETGKYYFEFLAGTRTGDMWVGSQSARGFTGNGTGYRHDGGISFNGSSAVAGTYATYTTGDIIGVALDMDGNTATYYKNGSQVASGTRGVSTKRYTTWIQLNNASDSGTMNFGQDSSFAGQKTAQGYTDANGIGDFYYQPPSGYLALCTANLPDPVAAIDPALGSNPEDHFNTVLWTGDGTSGRTVTGVGFQPDIIYYKSRSVTQPPQISDAVRGVYKMLRTSATDAEYNLTGGGMLQSFDADGFTVGTDPSINQSSQTYVAWNWKAGGTGASNTDGTITSTVSANTDAGISIVTYTGNGTGGATIGHGLDSTPSSIIVKRRDAVDGWLVYWDDFGGTDYLVLSSTIAKGTNSTVWNNTNATSSVFSVGTNGGVNASSGTYVAYCFQEVDGFSKFGSYTGNGSTDGPFVYCGFRPAFVIAKPSSTTGNWIMWDNTRDSYNAGERTLFPNLSSAEESGNVNESWDLLSNGFKLKSNGRVNVSGVTYIFMAFAEMPFKYANAR